MKKKARRTAELAQSITSGPAADPGLVDSFRSRFSDLPADQRLQFFRWLSGELEVEKSRIEAPIAAVIAASDDEPEAWNRHVRELRRALASPRHRLFEALIDTEGGLQAVLELRAEVLEAQRAGETGLEALEDTFDIEVVSTPSGVTHLTFQRKVVADLATAEAAID